MPLWSWTRRTFQGANNKDMFASSICKSQIEERKKPMANCGKKARKKETRLPFATLEKMPKPARLRSLLRAYRKGNWTLGARHVCLHRQPTTKWNPCTENHRPVVLLSTFYEAAVIWMSSFPTLSRRFTIYYCFCYCYYYASLLSREVCLQSNPARHCRNY